MVGIKIVDSFAVRVVKVYEWHASMIQTLLLCGVGSLLPGVEKHGGSEGPVSEGQ